MKRAPYPRPLCSGFTLMEVLIVVAIITTIIAILLPALGYSRRSAFVTVCLTRQSQLSSGIYSYVLDFGRKIPFGPTAPPGSLTNFYPITGCVTSLISLDNGAPVGVGLLLDKYLARNPEAVFCPGSDQPFDAAKQLARVGTAQAQGSYFYRHGSNFSFFAPPNTNQVRIDNLGVNRNGKLIRALAVDTNLLVNPNYAMFGIYTRTHHQRELSNALYSDGHSATLRNDAGQTDVPLDGVPHTALGRILEVLEWADAQ
jgi:prepilin-type N-terminal cleavage/methylation domain-containing protein